MDLSRVYFHNLLKDELMYEVTIRADMPENTVLKLKSQLKRLVEEFLPEEINSCDFDSTLELSIIKEKLADLANKVEEYKSNGVKSLLLRARALFCHLYYRIERVSDSESIKAELKSSLLTFQQFLEMADVSCSCHDASKQSNTCNKLSLPVSEPAEYHVSKWNVVFDGQGNPRSFIERIEELALAYSVSHSRLFYSAACLFTGHALTWYRGMKDLFSDWNDLKQHFYCAFEPVDYEYRLLGEIRSRSQGKDEPIHIYFAAMNCLFSRLKKQLTENEKLEILLHNIRPTYTQQLALVNIKSISELKNTLKRLESAKQMSELFKEPVPLSLNPEYSYKGISQPISIVNSNFKFSCPRCKVNTHTRGECTAGKIVKCFNCNLVGYTVKSCPKCNVSKNA